MVQADYRQHALKAHACPHALATLALVFINDDDAVSRPPQGDCTVHQGILPGCGLYVLDDLLGMGLAPIHYGQSLQMIIVELGGDSSHTSRWQRGLSPRGPPSDEEGRAER